MFRPTVPHLEGVPDGAGVAGCKMESPMSGGGKKGPISVPAPCSQPQKNFARTLVPEQQVEVRVQRSSPSTTREQSVSLQIAGKVHFQLRVVLEANCKLQGTLALQPAALPPPHL